MSSLDGRILELLKKYMDKLFHKKVLTSMEEVEANTNETNLVAAPVIAELNNKLDEQPEWIRDATGKITGYRNGGAGTVFPFSSFKVQKGSFSIVYGAPRTINTSSKVIAVLLAEGAGERNTPYWDGKQLCDNSFSHGAVIASNRMSVTFKSNQTTYMTFNYTILCE